MNLERCNELRLEAYAENQRLQDELKALRKKQKQLMHDLRGTRISRDNYKKELQLEKLEHRKTKRESKAQLRHALRDLALKTRRAS